MDEARERYHIQTYGCQMNEHDSEVLAGILEQEGLVEAEDITEAGVVLVNTCCVRESAEQRILGELGRLKLLKYKNPDVVMGVCGCMVMNDDSLQEIRRRASHVDFVIGTNQLHRLPEFLQRARKERQLLVERDRVHDVLPTDLPRRRASGVRAWVPIIYGCDNYCAYCIVPYVRGPERSRPPEGVVDDVRKLAADGVREITLLGQNVNSYGHDLQRDMNFADLLEVVDGIPGIRWIRYTTSHPRDYSHELVERIAELDSVCEHFHLPVQSGSDRILQQMNRGYTRAQYLDLINHIRAVHPHSAITTDVIVGFPGETEEDFCATYSLFERVRFDNAFSFLYSPRSGTRAAQLPGQVSREVRGERLDRLNQLQHGISLECNRPLEGEELTVLVDGPSERDASVMRGRTRTNKLVLLPEAGDWENQFVRARIERAEPYQLIGHVTGGDEN